MDRRRVHPPRRRAGAGHVAGGISKSTVSKLCKDIDERVNEFLDRPLNGEWPCVWLDATCLKVRQGGRIVSVAAMIAVAANTDGRREIIGLGLGPSEAETFWMDFLRGLKARGLDGAKLPATPTTASGQAWSGSSRRPGSAGASIGCAMLWHTSRAANTLSSPPQSAKPSISPTANRSGRPGAASPTSSRSRWPKLADLMDQSEHDVRAYMAFPRQHRTKLPSTNPIERLNKEVKRRADVVGIFPNEVSIMRLIGAVPFERCDEWLTASRDMQVEAFAQIDHMEVLVRAQLKASMRLEL